ncbi:MAG: hypothetical protein M1548_06720 [Actinobacteria bacterium]|nr:hypothetical protein [Actinomycetota bacterium]
MRKLQSYAELCKAETYGYDSIGRLTSWIKTGGAGNANEAYTYDAAGNITAKGTRTFTYDAADRITSSNLYSDFSYDENGNLTRYVSSDNKTYDLAYNAYDQLTQVKIDGVIKANYEYNYKNLRSVKKDAAGAVVKRYHYDKNDQLVRESDAAGATVAYYTWNDKGQPVSLTRTVNQNGTPVTVTYYYHLNGHGDVRMPGSHGRHGM